MSKKRDSLTATKPMPPGLSEWLTIRMLGEPFAEYQAETGNIKRGYSFAGKKYYYPDKQ